MPLGVGRRQSGRAGPPCRGPLLQVGGLAVIPEALALLRRERRRTVDEREAFEAFSETVRAMAAETSESGLRVGGLSGSPSPEAGQPIRRAYERTVMAVPHYAEEYDDTYTESLEAELGAPVAAAATSGSLTPTTRAGIVRAATRARADRERFVEALDEERESLLDADDRLGAVLSELADLETEPREQLDFGGLDAIRARITVLQSKTDAVGRERQQQLRTWQRELSLAAGAPDLPSYLYQEAPVSYPILSAVARTATKLERLRAAVERQMWR